MAKTTKAVEIHNLKVERDDALQILRESRAKMQAVQAENGSLVSRLHQINMEKDALAASLERAEEQSLRNAHLAKTSGALAKKLNAQVLELKTKLVTLYLDSGKGRTIDDLDCPILI